MLLLPVLYSFRRCPYAIRARLAIAASGILVEVLEVDLKAKPERMQQLSVKATVPVLELPDGRVIDESLDIMLWALQQNDPATMLDRFSNEARALIEHNDTQFKYTLDRYKYPECYPEFPMSYYRIQAENFLCELNIRLNTSHFILGDKAGIVDLALLPFIRQFARVDKVWFEASPYASLRMWLNAWEASDVFIHVMRKDARLL